jgi:aspartate dehydrogenase
MVVKTVGLAGLGFIGLDIAQALDAGIFGLRLIAVADRNPDRGRQAISSFKAPPRLTSLGELAEADIIIEALPASIFDSIAVPVIEAGKILIPCSVGALLTRAALIERARQTGARIIVPTGAIAGLDAVRAVAQESIQSATLEIRKPPKALTGVDYLESRGIDVAAMTAPEMVFAGNAMDAARHFPANANVAAALALASIGPTRTQVEIWADPTIDRNIHKITIQAASACLSICVQNVPSSTNPRTSKLAALSIRACLAGLAGPIKVGS